MAVSSALTLIHACEAATDATTSAVLTSTSGGSFLTDPGEYVQGSAAYGFDLDIETHTVTITPTASINLSGQTVWFWMNSLTPNYFGTWASGAINCTLSDGTNSSTWYVSGSPRILGKWTRLCFSTSSTPDAISGTLTVTAVTSLVFSFTGVTKSKLPENTFIDYIQYAADGVGMTVPGGTSGTPLTFADVAASDVAAAIGMTELVDGVNFLNGPVQYSSTVSGDMYFQDSDQVVVAKTHYRTFTTANRGTAESLVAAAHYTLTITGSSTATNSFVLGAKSGTRGVSGCTLKTGGDRKIVFTATSANLNILKLYGSNFIGCGVTSLPVASAGNREVISTSFNACSKVIVSTCKFQYNNIVNATDSGIEVSSTSWDVTDNNFIGCVNGFEFLTAGTYGNTGNIDTNNTYDVKNNSAGLVTLNNTGGSNASTVINIGVSTTTINTAITLKFVVTDEDNVKISGAYAYIDDNNITPFILNSTTDVNGEASVVHSAGPVTGSTWRVRKYGYKQFKQSVDIGSTDLTQLVTLVADPQQT